MAFIERLGVAVLGAMSCAGGIVVASFAPHDSPVRAVAVLFAICGALAAVLTLLSGVRQRRRAGAPDAQGIAPAESPTAQASPAPGAWESQVESLTALAVLLLSLGAFLYGAGGWSKLALGLGACSLPAFLAAATILARHRGRKWTGVFVTLFLILAGTPFWAYLGEKMFGRPWKQPTVGYAELHSKSQGGRYYLDLPAGWRAEYRGRDRHEPHEAYLVDAAGSRRFDVYAGTFARLYVPSMLDQFAEEMTTTWQGIADRNESEIEFLGGEFRDGPLGRVWLARFHHPPPSGYGGREWQDKAVVTSAFHAFLGPRLIVVEFHMPAEEVAELEPLAWELFQGVRFVQ